MRFPREILIGASTAVATLWLFQLGVPAAGALTGGTSASSPSQPTADDFLRLVDNMNAGRIVLSPERLSIGSSVTAGDPVIGDIFLEIVVEPFREAAIEALVKATSDPEADSGLPPCEDPSPAPADATSVAGSQAPCKPSALPVNFSDPQHLLLLDTVDIDGVPMFHELLDQALSRVTLTADIPNLGNAQLLATDAFTGQALDSNGEPVPGVRVGFAEILTDGGNFRLAIITFAATPADFTHIASYEYTFGSIPDGELHATGTQMVAIDAPAGTGTATPPAIPADQEVGQPPVAEETPGPDGGTDHADGEAMVGRHHRGDQGDQSNQGGRNERAPDHCGGAGTSDDGTVAPTADADHAGMVTDGSDSTATMAVSDGAAVGDGNAE